MEDDDVFPTPSVPFVGSIALVRRLVDSEEEWLVLWDASIDAFRLIQATRGDGESFRSCLDAVIERELGLNRRRDYVVSGLSRAHFQAPVEWPENAGLQWIIVEFFTVDLYGAESHSHVETLPQVRWVKMSEFANGRTLDGDAICERQRILIDRAELLPAWLRE